MLLIAVITFSCVPKIIVDHCCYFFCVLAIVFIKSLIIVVAFYCVLIVVVDHGCCLLLCS